MPPSLSLSALGVQSAPPSWEDPRLRAKPTHLGHALTIYDVFYSFLSTMRRIALSGPETALHTFISGPARTRETWEVPQGGVLDNPWLIKVFPFVSGGMLRRGRFVEAEYEIYVDVELVGEGAMLGGGDILDGENC